MSCPHAKGYGAEVGQDTELMRAITEAVVRITEAPVFVKLSAMLPNLAGSAGIAIAAGAAGITLTNTIGPAMAEVGRRFESGRMQLPFVLRSAEAMRAALDRLLPTNFRARPELIEALLTRL